MPRRRGYSASRATRKVLSKFGAFVRRGAKSSIRNRKATSAPGSPPSSHVGTLKRLIFFAYDPGRKSVVIGPTPFNTSEGVAPPLLEYGGTTVIRRRGKVRTATYRPCPFMKAFTFHDLRRSCITNWAKVLPIHVVQELAGHSDIKTAQRHYLAVREDDMEAARQAQSAILKNGSTDQLLTNSPPKSEISAL